MLLSQASTKDIRYQLGEKPTRMQAIASPSYTAATAYLVGSQVWPTSLVNPEITTLVSIFSMLATSFSQDRQQGVHANEPASQRTHHAINVRCKAK